MKRVPVALVAAAITLSCIAIPSRQTGAACETPWGRSKQLETADGRPVYIEQPTFVGRSDSLVLLGWPSFQWAERQRFDPPPGSTREDTLRYIQRLESNIGFAGFAFRPGKPAQPLRPAQAGIFMSPVAATRSNAADVLWFRPKPETETPVELWHADLRPDRSWGPATKVFLAEQLFEPPVVFADGEDIHIILRFYRQGGAGIAYVRRVLGTWKTTETVIDNMPSQLTAVVFGDSLLVGFVGNGARLATGFLEMNLFVIRAAVNDSLWPQPRKLRDPVMDFVSSPRLFRRASVPDVVTLTWKRHKQVSEGSDSLFAIVSLDAGRTWTAPRRVETPFEILRLSEFQDQFGIIHTIVTPAQASVAGAPMYYLTFNSATSEWSTLAQMGGEFTGSSPAFVPIGRDSLAVFWGEARHAGREDDAVAPVARYAIRPLKCETHN